MGIDDYLKSYSSPSVHSKISTLTQEQKHKVKRFIDDVVSETHREFIITELELINSRIEIAVCYRVTLF